MKELFLILALVSSLSIALILRIAESRSRNRLIIVAANYISATFLAAQFFNPGVLTLQAFMLGAFVGIFFFWGFLLFGTAIRRCGIGEAVTVGRISLVIPVIMSVVLWGEKPGLLPAAGIVLIILVLASWEGKMKRPAAVLLALFFVFGLIDTAMKFFSFRYPEVGEGSFLSVVFGFALMWSWGYVFAFRFSSVTIKDVVWGLGLGIPNFFSSYFLIASLNLLPAYVVFPFINIGMILLSILSGVMFFKEKVSARRMVLVAAALFGVFLLTRFK